MHIEDKIDALEKKVDLLLSLVGGDSVIMTVTDIAAFYGKHRASLYTNNRWLLPNFGVAEDGFTPVSSWPRKIVMEWNVRDIEERKNELKGRVFPVNKKG